MIKQHIEHDFLSLGIDDINLLLRSKSTRKKFIEDAVKYTRTNGYDGLDLDFKCTLLKPFLYIYIFSIYSIKFF